MKLRIAFLITTLLIFAAASMVANAGIVGPTTITEIDTRNDGTFLITTSATITQSPPCVTETVRMWGDAKTVGGKNILAGALTAMASGKSIALEGRNTCGEYLTIESIFRLSIK